MIKVISTEKRPIKLWLDDIEEGAFEQARNLANLPFAFRHIAIMPDCHQGYGMPIGGIMATQKVIVPNAVGVDIGCGMCALKTSLVEIDIDKLKKIMGEVRKQIPVGFNHHEQAQDEKYMPLISSDRMIIAQRQYQSALKQIGTLGGGNHFIEFQKGNDDHIWIMIHSGSRNIGYKVAQYYNDLAIKLNEEYFSSVPKEWQLAFLPLNSEEGRCYRKEMEYCIYFALANRKLMMERIKKIILDFYSDIEFDDMINIAHNYAAVENHFNENVIVHRKGATLARKGQIGIIPGSQGTKSYIVRGLGNKESFESCSHGAGRRLGRNQAKRELNLEDEKRKLDELDIIHSVRNENDLDEATGAYKNISTVMNNQSDLVEIVIELKPLAVIKWLAKEMRVKHDSTCETKHI